jgi:hypothetical protein
MRESKASGRPSGGIAAAAVVAAIGVIAGCTGDETYVAWCDPQMPVVAHGGATFALGDQTTDVSAARSTGCVSCHKNVGDPHEPGTKTNLACVDCHGGDGLALAKEDAHPKPKHPERWKTSANPEGSYALLNDEHLDWIMFVNPGDLRAAPKTCGPCHATDVLNVSKSVMTTAAHFWGTASYSNGIVPLKKTFLGESYSPDGTPQKVNNVPPPTEAEIARGVVPTLYPLPNFEVTQPGNVYRVFEKGSRLPNPLIGNPDKLEDPGRPNNRLSDRGFGTLNRVDLPLLNVHKTRLNDPHLSFMGTNDQPGDYRSSGCTACHVVYANDRSPVHSGPYASKGHRGFATDNPDPTIPKNEPGHPIDHRFTKAIPSSQCMVCHMHQPNSFLNTYYGFQMWSYETDGAAMWPEARKNPTHAELVETANRNPEGAAAFGKWGDRDFLENVSDLNPTLKHTQFADYHGHGWIFRGVFKTDRKGNLLDKDDAIIPYDDPHKFKGVVPRLTEGDAGPAPSTDSHRRAVHLKDVHAEYGMHCTDCHFTQDVHGDGKLYGEYQAAVSIKCDDCHGTARRYATLRLSGPSSASLEDAPDRRRLDSGAYKTPWGERRFERRTIGARVEIVQRSMVEPKKEWIVRQVKDSVDPLDPAYNERAAYAKTIRKDGKTWGDLPKDPNEPCPLAHGESEMDCYACHTSWVTSCFGCHLPQKALWKSDEYHFEGKARRNYATYNPQVARDDAFMLAVPGKVKRAPGQKTKYSTARSSSAVLISSEDGLRRKIYAQQATVAGNGMSSQAFNTHFAHTVRKRETRKCDDCHVSANEDNNAWLAQTYLLGTNFVNFVGYRAFVACGEDGFEAVRVTEWDEPQAVLGSNLHRLAYPEIHRAFEEGGRKLGDAVHHGSNDARSAVLRGEYLYVASGEGGLRAYDVANVNNKDFSEPIVTSPVSPLGQDTHVSTRFATAVALGTNNPTSLARTFRPENGETNYAYRGRDQYLHESYRYAYVTDRYEGLVLVDVDCLTDGDPQNNFLKRALAFNPDGALDGAENLAVAGTTVYVCCAKGVVVVDVSDPLEPKILTVVGAPHVRLPRAIAVQFRYAFVADADGLAVLDVTDPARATAVEGSRIKLADARDVYAARTYAYVAGGAQGLVIVDIERPRAPKIDQVFDGGGAIGDLHQVKVGMTNDSVFAYLADGVRGLHVVQLVTPEDGGRSAYGFSPRPMPKLIATRPTGGPALAVAKGLDRDRAVDESGHQMAVFGRFEGRPLDLEEMRRLFLKDGAVWRVENAPPPRGGSAGSPAAAPLPPRGGR